MTLACFLSFSNSNPQTHTERALEYEGEEEYEFEDDAVAASSPYVIGGLFDLRISNRNFVVDFRCP
ncbi:MAG TPA: hypothetical protein VFO40_09165 [Chthoniobacterales bacterium]|nr:hypothetical protein [Chthoniobacterales bacterium]